MANDIQKFQNFRVRVGIYIDSFSYGNEVIT